MRFLIQDFAQSSSVIDLVSSVEFRRAVGLMVAVCRGLDGGEGIVQILDFKALENVKNAVSGMKVVVNYCALAASLKEINQ